MEATVRPGVKVETPGRGDWFFAPSGPLSPRATAVWVLVLALCTLGWSAYRAGKIFYGPDLPDVNFYRLLAEGHMDQVPRPFSARPLQPMLAGVFARELGAVSGGPAAGFLNRGFAALAYLSLGWAAAAVFLLLIRRRTPVWVLLLVASAPFWWHMMRFAGLPDPLYVALTSTLLVALEYEQLFLAALLFFPLMLTRESTSLMLLCFLLVGFRRLRWARGVAAVACVALAALLVRYLSRNSLPNPEQLGGGLYMVGKLVANSLRSVGFLPWSNVYPELCRTPAWQTGLHLSRVESVGVCPWDAEPFREVVWAILSTFGVLLPLLVVGRGRWRSFWRESNLATRFSVVYGVISFLLGPALGTWYIRLVSYGWPLLLVGAPALVAAWERSSGQAVLGSQARRWAVGLLLILQLAICGVTLEQRFSLLDALPVLQGVGLGLIWWLTSRVSRAVPAAAPTLARMLE